MSMARLTFTITFPYTAPTAPCPKHAVERFAVGGGGNVKKLQGIDPPEFRLHVGDYRVRLHQDGETVRVLRVRNRRDGYR